MIYLAAPYKDEDPSLMAERLEEVTRVAQKDPGRPPGLLPTDLHLPVPRPAP